MDITEKSTLTYTLMHQKEETLNMALVIISAI